MPRVSRTLALFSLLLALSGPPSSAFAAPASWDSVDVTVHQEQGRAIMLVSGTLPETTALPAEVALSVPAGSQVQWAGEILGGPVDKDPSVQYKTITNNGVDTYTFTLAKSRTGQLEVLPQALVTATADGFQSNLSWTAGSAVRELRLNFRVPQTAKIVTPAAGAAVQPGPTGYSYYSRVVRGVKAGQTEGLAFSYSTAVAGASGGAATTRASDTVIPMVIILAALAFFGVLAVNVRKKMSLKSAPVVESKARDDRKPASPAASNAGSKSSGTRKPGSAAPPTPTKRMKPIVPMIALVAVLVVGFAAAGMKGTSATTVDGKLTRNFGSPSACQSASLSFTPNQGVDLSRQGEQLLKAFEGMEGVGDVTLDIVQSKIDMGWCESSQTEETMRQAVTATGLVTLSEDGSSSALQPSTATVDAAGKSQTVSVDTSNESFAPSQIGLKAGVPAEISFAKATGCVGEVVFESLGIRQDLSQGATVRLPALEVGTYSFACGMGHVRGQLVVQ